MVAYKLFRIKKDGSLGTLFINRQLNLTIGTWFIAENHPTRGFAVRPGWHCTLVPVAPHLKLELKSGEIRKWFKVEIADFKYHERPESQGGTWVLANELKILEEVC